MGQPDAVGTPPKPPFLRTRLLPALLSAGLLYLCFFPVNWGWLGWVALTPLLWLTVAPDPRRVKLAAWLGGLVFFIAATEWVRLANDVMYAGWILLALFISIAFPVFVWLTRLLTFRFGAPLVLAAPTAWVAGEYIRANINVGFAWYYLGHTQHDFLAVIQIADVFGAYGVSFLVVMGNVALFEHGRWIYQWASRGRESPVGGGSAQNPPGVFAPGSPALALVIAGVALLLSLTYGAWRMSDDEFPKGPKIALIQGNLPQSIKDDPGAIDRTAAHFRALADKARDLSPDLIVWSETSWPFAYFEIDPAAPPVAIDDKWRSFEAYGRELIQDLHARYRIPTLMGINTIVLDPDGEKHYNSALLIDAAGKLTARYEKIELVPFGEYIPYQDYVPIMKWLSPYEEENDYGIAPGKSHTIFEFMGRRFAVLICYEDSVPHLARTFMRQEQAPDYFLNISNDGWFHGSQEHEQHLVAARFRAVECRRAIGRAVNMGISCIIDGNGRVHELPGKSWADAKGRTDPKKCPEHLREGTVVTGHIPLDSRASLYVFWGDVLPQACWIVCLGGIMVAVFRRRRRATPPMQQ